MKKIISLVLSLCMLASMMLFAMPAQAEPYEGYPFVFEDFEDGNCAGFYGPSLSYLEGGVGGSLGAMAVRNKSEQYNDVSYDCANPPIIGGKFRFSTWVRIHDEIKQNKLSFIFYGQVNVHKTDKTVEGPDVKQVTGWKQVSVPNAGLKVGEWVKISYDAAWDGFLGCNPGVGYNNATESKPVIYSDDIVSMTRFSIRVGEFGGTKDLVDTEDTSFDYDLDDVTYEIAPAEIGELSIGKNIIKNGEFDENFEGWSLPGVKEIIQDGTAPDGSKGYLKLSNKDGAAVSFDVEQSLTWQANHMYHVSFWAKMFDTEETNKSGGTWLLQIGSASIVDENGLKTSDTAAPYPGVDKHGTLTAGGDWVKYDYYFVNEYKTYTEQPLRTWLRIFPDSKQHVPSISTVGLDSVKIIDLGPISGGDMETSALENEVYVNSAAASQTVLGWNVNNATVAQSDDVSLDSTGAKSMKVTVDADGGYVYKGIALEKDNLYRISFRAKGENLENDVPIAMVLDRSVPQEGSNDCFVVPDYEYYTGAKEALNEYTQADMESQSWKLTNEWQTYTCVVSNEFPLKEGILSAMNYTFPRLPFMYFLVDGDNKAGTTYYIDDITIEKTASVPVPAVKNASVIGKLLPGGKVSVNYTFTNTGEGTDKSFVRMLVETESGEYASLVAFDAKESVTVPESAIGKHVVFEIVPVDSENFCGKSVYVEAEEVGDWTAMFYDRKQEIAKVYSSEDKKCDLIVAAYKDNQLVQIEVTPVNIIANEKTEVELQNIDQKEADTVKMFLWDSITSVKPLCDANVFDCSTPVETNVFLLGDSVCVDYGASSFWQQGWGHCFPDVVNEYLAVYNKGLGGRSSKTYIEQGLWDDVKAEIMPGDYVIINFGLNDIHSPVVTETSDGRGTTIEDYKKYLTQYCEESKALGATPVLVSTIAEMSGSYTTLQKRALAMKEVAEAQEISFIDLNTYMNNLLLFDENGELDVEKRQASFDSYYLSTVAFEKIEKEFNCKVPQTTLDYVATTTDRTHINIYGAQLVAESIAKLLKESDSYLKNYMK